jgi:hypothetical protein
VKLEDEIQLLMRDPDWYEVPDCAFAIMEGKSVSQWELAEILVSARQLAHVHHLALLHLAAEIDDDRRRSGR